MRLKELREERGLTQLEVAQAINTSQSNIARWEKSENDPAAAFVTKLADYFDVSVDYLLERTDELGASTVRAEVIERPPFDITDKQLVDVVKLFGVMSEIQKARVLGYIIAYLESEGINVGKVLGY